MPRSITFTDGFGHEFTDLSHEVDDDHDSDYEYAPTDDVEDDGDVDDDELPGDDFDHGDSHTAVNYQEHNFHGKLKFHLHNDFFQSRQAGRVNTIPLTPFQKQVLVEVENMLAPIAKIQRSLEGDKYPTISYVPFYVWKTRETLKARAQATDADNLSFSVRQLVQKMLDDIEKIVMEMELQFTMKIMFLVIYSGM